MKTLNLPPNTPTLNNVEILTRIIGGSEGFVIFTQKEGKKWRQLGALPAGVAHKIYEIIPKADMLDLYFTINTFYRVGPEMKNGLRKVYNKRTTPEGVEMMGSRQEKNLQDLRCLYVDMDIYQNKSSTTWRDAMALVMKMADKGLIPQPTFFANSGRGAYAIWTITPHESKAADLLNYKAVNRALNCKFRNYSALLEPDNVFDGSRVLRVPGSINSKAPDSPVTYVVQFDHDGRPYEHSLEGAAALLGVTLTKPKPKAGEPLSPPTSTPTVAPITLMTAAAPKSPAAPINQELRKAGQRGMKALGERRMKELLEIIRLKGVCQGFRYKTLFILASTARIAKYEQAEATATLEDLAADFSPPYPGTDANDIPVSSIVAAAYRGKIVKHSATGLAKFFKLSTEECRSLVISTVYTEEISRIKKTPKRNNKAKLEAAITKEADTASSLSDLCKKLFSLHAIFISKSQVRRYVKRLGLKVGHHLTKIAA